MPQVLPLGVSMNEFWSLNPHKVWILIDAYNEKTKRDIALQNTMMHIQGQYFADALLSVVGNMFRSKGEPYKYPDAPYKLNLEEEEVLSDEEKLIKEREQFIAKLNIMFGNIEKAVQINERNGADE